MKKYRLIAAVTNDLTYDRRMIRICTSLANAGYDVELVGRALKTSAPLTSQPFRQVRLKCFFMKGPLFYAEYNARLTWYLLGRKFDAACACDLDTVVAVTKASWLKNKKTIYDAHEYFTEVPELTGRNTVKKTWELIARNTIKRFDLRYTVGPALAKLMSAKYQVPFHVIRNIPSESQKQVFNRKTNEKIILYQGAINEGRGLSFIIEAIKELPGWQFWMAGEGDIIGELKNLIVSLGLNERIRMLGWIHPDALPALMAQAMIGINLRETGSLNDYYSLPNKFFDFIHAQLPSINMAYPEYQEVVKEFPCSLLIPSITVNSIVESVLSLENDPDKMERMKQACAQAAAFYTWEKEEEKLLQLYRQILPA